MRSITALSIANDAIRAAVIADPYSDLPTIKHFQAIPLPNGAVVDGEVVDHDVVAGLLNTLVKRFKFPREDTALVYSSRRMVFREADFPYMSLNDLKSTLPFQAKGMIPLPIEESELDFVPLNVIDSEQGKQLHGILVATLRNGLEKTARTAEDAGFAITSIDAGPFALARLFADTNQQQTEAVVNISGNGTDVIVLENGQPAYMRVVPSGADDVTDAIANALSISFEDAERIKNQIGLQNVTGEERQSAQRFHNRVTYGDRFFAMPAFRAEHQPRNDGNIVIPCDRGFAVRAETAFRIYQADVVGHAPNHHVQKRSENAADYQRCHE